MEKSKINTKHVFEKDNQVYLKNEDKNTSKKIIESDYYPINFQWIPVIEVQNSLIIK